jgi:AraC-like DNA-binding protein
VSLKGTLSERDVTIGVVLGAVAGSWHWLKEVQAGSVGVFRAGDTHDALYRSRAIYVAATLSLDQLELEAARENLVLDGPTLGGSRLHPKLMDPSQVEQFRSGFASLHRSAPCRPSIRDADISGRLLRDLVAHFARHPRLVAGQGRNPGHERIVARARDYIHAHLSEPIGVDDLVSDLGTSRSTLHRAFVDLLGESPQRHIRRLRLHRIRRELVASTGGGVTVTSVGNLWGIDQPGRLAGWYREIFGELPSRTLLRPRAQED